MEEDSGQEPGTVVRVDKDGFLVQTGKGLLKVTALQIPGKKRMEADAFLRGYSMEPGEKLGIKKFLKMYEKQPFFLLFSYIILGRVPDKELSKEEFICIFQCILTLPMCW